MVDSEVWIQVSAGDGPEECCWVVPQVVKKITEEAKEHGIKIREIHVEEGESKKTAKSVLLALSQQHSFIQSWEGTIQWVGESQFRPHHKRKNWFVGVECYAPPQKQQWQNSELEISYFRGSGPGGQHRNKVETGVKITHIPTGLVVVAGEERSQQMNKKLAFARLAHTIGSMNESELKQKKNVLWQQHKNLERGNPVRVFKGEKFKESRKG